VATPKSDTGHGFAATSYTKSILRPVAGASPKREGCLQSCVAVWTEESLPFKTLSPRGAGQSHMKNAR